LPIALRTQSHSSPAHHSVGRGRTRSRPRSGRAIFVLCIVAPLLYTLYGSIKPYRTPVAEAVPTADRQPLTDSGQCVEPPETRVCHVPCAAGATRAGPRALSRPHPFVYFMTAFFRQELIRARYHEWCAKPCAERARCTGKGLSPVSHPWLVGRFQPWLAGLRPEMQPARHRRHRRRRRRGLCAAQGACAARSSS
jgi:hypothetical protein